MANSKLTSVKFTDDDFNCIVENDDCMFFSYKKDEREDNNDSTESG